MQFEGAVVKEQGITFAIVIVKRFVTESQSRASEAIRSFSSFFPGLPIVLMSQDSRGMPTYFGRKDIANFLASVPMQAIPWKRYSYS
ncbi:MAG: hypothetical protein J0L55_10175 [Caulobacterales bacterium]|nr:hypothetical protein [Caulobacterales bacterium]